VGVGVLALVFVAGAHQYRARAPLRSLEAVACEAVPAAARTLEDRRFLDLSNRVAWGGPWRDVRVSGAAELREGAILEIRLRTPSNPDPVGSSARGFALWISHDPRVATGLYLEDSGRFEPLAGFASQEIDPSPTNAGDKGRPEGVPSGPGAGSRPSGDSLQVSFSVEATGHLLRAEVIDEAGARHQLRARSDRFPGGGVQVVAAKGEAVLSELSVDPLARVPVPPGWMAPEVVKAALAPFSLALLVAVVGVVLLGVRPLRAAVFGVLAALPLVAVLAFIDPLASTAAGGGGSWPPAGLLGSLLIALILPLSRHRELTFFKLVGFGAVAGAAALAAQKPLLRPAPWPLDILALNHLSYLEWSGDRIDEDLLHLMHPLVRRFHFQLADHRFRGRGFRKKAEAEVTRVLAVGTSSTWGLGVKEGEDYPTVLEQLLNAPTARDAGTPRFEVMNAGVCGSVGHRLLRILEHQWMEFEPDVVTVNLRYNDGAVLCGPDEAEYLERITTPEYSRSAFGSFLDRLAQQEGVRGFGELREALVAGEELVWSEDRGPTPAARFESTLRGFADLCRDRGVQLILIIEPLNARWFFAEELAAAVHRVAEEAGLDVVDPSGAIRRAGGPALFLDTVHPNAAGHQVIANELLPVVRRVP